MVNVNEKDECYPHVCVASGMPFPCQATKVRHRQPSRPVDKGICHICAILSRGVDKSRVCVMVLVRVEV